MSANEMKQLENLIMRLVIDADNAWETLDEIQAKVDANREWMIRLVEQKEAGNEG